VYVVEHKQGRRGHSGQILEQRGHQGRDGKRGRRLEHCQSVAPQRWHKGAQRRHQGVKQGYRVVVALVEGEPCRAKLLMFKLVQPARQ
jgi:hypothetical protein